MDGHQGLTNPAKSLAKPIDQTTQLIRCRWKTPRVLTG